MLLFLQHLKVRYGWWLEVKHGFILAYNDC